jgi:hypothetical protein
VSPPLTLRRSKQALTYTQVFVNFDNPDQQEGDDFRKRVRSQAATYSHRVAPRKGTKVAKYRQRTHGSHQPSLSRAASSSIESASSTPAAPASTSSPSGGPANKAKTGQSRAQPILPLPAGEPRGALPQETPRSQWRAPSPNPPKLLPRRSPQSPVQRLQAGRSARTPNPANIRRKRSHSRPHSEVQPAILIPYGRLSDPVYMDQSKKDPFLTYPVPFEAWYGWLLDYWFVEAFKDCNMSLKRLIDSHFLLYTGIQASSPAANV